MAAEELVAAAFELRTDCDELTFGRPVSFTYNPLVYAWDAHRAYLLAYGRGTKRVVFVGMNPGPWGMAQVGVPFGEIQAVRGWLGISAGVTRPEREHPKRPIEGFECTRSEVSGRRLWGLFAARYPSADAFFEDHFVANYCPLMFLEESGRNRTPDKLARGEREALFDACDRHLRRVVDSLQPDWVIGVGGFAAGRAQEALAGSGPRVAKILHPSPASPAANRGWAEAVTRQMQALGVWA